MFQTGIAPLQVVMMDHPSLFRKNGHKKVLGTGNILNVPPQVMY
jgi:hypothetical protein